jgi:hypothetical protein
MKIFGQGEEVEYNGDGRMSSLVLVFEGKPSSSGNAY